ncbi:hypothetical protein O6H91_Y108000 [Diphasiastrum complanatum]|nr:hypothetical protein O6H91_Y108000 [Diphasiastrum complanatum]
MAQHSNVALVAGVTGIVGSRVGELLTKPDTKGGPWKVYGIGSRAKPDWILDQVHYIQIDLLNRDQTLSKLSQLSDVTHLFWAVWTLRHKEDENIKCNGSMLQNVVDALMQNAQGFRHISLTTGGKHYVGPFDLFGKMKPHDPPYQEDLPRLEAPNFYYTLEDIVFETAKKKAGALTWSVHRPGMVFGFAPRNHMNIVGALAVYAALCKHEGKPLAFPGSKYTWEKLVDASDAELIAAQEVWAANTPATHNQAFNTMNGDVFSWKRMWHKLADRFGLEVPPYNGERTSLKELLKDKSSVWDEIVSVNHLVPTKLEDVGQFWFVDVVLGGTTLQPILDTNKSKEYGFLEFRNSEKSFLHWVDKLKEDKIVP